MNMTKCMKMVAPDVLKNQDLNTQAHFCEKNFIRNPSNMTLQLSQCATNLCDANGVNNSTYFEKLKHKYIEDLLKCAITFLFFYYV